MKARHQLHLRYEDLGDQLDSKRIYMSNLERDPGSPQVQSPSSSSNPILGLGKMMIGGIGAIGDKLHNMMDSNPELTRRTQIAKLRETIAQVRSHLTLGEQIM